MIEPDLVEPRSVSQASGQIDIGKRKRQRLTGKTFGYQRCQITRDFVTKDWSRGILIAILDPKIGEMFRMHEIDANVAGFCRLSRQQSQAEHRQQQQVKKPSHTDK